MGLFIFSILFFREKTLVGGKSKKDREKVKLRSNLFGDFENIIYNNMCKGVN